MGKVSFIAGGGANNIGGSFYVLKVGDINIGLEFGANLGGWEGIEPVHNIVPHLDYLLLSHAHFDHIGLLPVAFRKFPGVKIFASPETKELGRILWRQTLRKAVIDGVTPPFTEEESNNAYEAVNVLPFKDEIRLAGDRIIVYPVPAGHILGSLSFLIIIDGKFYFFTGDLCPRDRSLIKSAMKIGLEKCKLLIRESTYINERFKKSRAEEIDNLVNFANKTIKRRGKVLIAALSIDRAQDIFSICHEAGLGPIYLDGSRNVFEIYRRFLSGAEVLGNARWFRSEWERKNFSRSSEPAIVIASSGMMYKGSPSAILAGDMVYKEENAVALVNYQDPSGQGHLLANAKKGQVILFNGSSVRVKCEVRQFNFSAHMDGKEGEELEERTNPETIIYVHGEDRKIDEYIGRHKDGRRRIKAVVGKEVDING